MLRLLAAAITAAVVTSAPSISLPLDGKTFKATLVKAGQAKGDADTLEFKAGNFHSSGCDAHGFKAGPYLVEKSDGALAFTAVSGSEKEGTMAWRGTVRGSAIEGKAVWSKDGQPDVEFTFKGEEQAP